MAKKKKPKPEPQLLPADLMERWFGRIHFTAEPYGINVLGASCNDPDCQSCKKLRKLRKDS